MISNQSKAKSAVQKLKQWIKSNPNIPLHHGRINKTEICRIIEIPVSTLRSNPELSRLIGKLAVDNYKAPAPAIVESDSPVIAALQGRIKQQQLEITRLRAEVARYTMIFSMGVDNRDQ